MRQLAAATAVVIGLIVAVSVLASSGAGAGTGARLPATAPTGGSASGVSASGTSASGTSASGASMPGRTSTRPQMSERSVQSVAIAFAASYGRFLNGQPGRLADASITATDQARQAGRFPVSFRDGAVRAVALGIDATAASAEAYVILANRQQRFPFQFQLLREGGPWIVTAIVPPDLAVDRSLRPVHVTTPVSIRAAVMRFVVAYVRYRALRGARPPGMTSRAAGELAAGRDPLAGVNLPPRAPRVVSVAYGPVNEVHELAVTATVRFGSLSEQVSLMFQRLREGRWLCAAFL